MLTGTYRPLHLGALSTLWEQADSTTEAAINAAARTCGFKGWTSSICGGRVADLKFGQSTPAAAQGATRKVARCVELPGAALVFHRR